MTTLDERYTDLLTNDHDPRLEQLVAELDAMGEGSPSPRGDMMIRHALTARGRDLSQQGRNRPAPVGGARQGRWTRLLRARLSVAVAASVAVLLGASAYLHGQGPTPVSAQTVLHRAAAASPGANEATHATYRVSSSDGSTGSADVWIGYDGSGVPNELALNLSMTQDGSPAAGVSGSVVAAGTNLLEAYSPGDMPGQVSVPGESGNTARLSPGQSPPTPKDCVPCGTLKGMVIGSLLAQKLSAQPDAYKLQQETLNGVPVYALQSQRAAGVTFYFNVKTYMLVGADWVQGSTSWQARLGSYSTVPLSDFPVHTTTTGTGADQKTTQFFGPKAAAGQQQGKPFLRRSQGSSAPSTQHG